MKKIILPLMVVLLFVLTSSSIAQTSDQHRPNTLDINRKKIDSLDRKLFEIIVLREKVVREIGEYKAKNNIPTLQASRFQEVLKQAIAAGKKQNLSADFVTEMMNAIHKESLRIENTITGQGN